MLDTAEEKERAQRRSWERMQPPGPGRAGAAAQARYPAVDPYRSRSADRRMARRREREYLHELLAQLLAEMPAAERGERGPPACCRS